MEKQKHGKAVPFPKVRRSHGWKNKIKPLVTVETSIRDNLRE